jgi:ribosomal protein L2
MRRLAAGACSASTTAARGPQRRGIKQVNPANTQGVVHYSPETKMKAGQDMSLKMTEMYDGYTDDFGVFKEGPPTTLRLEYIRSPEHLTNENILHKYLWSPFEVAPDMRGYSPLYYDATTQSSRDIWGHRSGGMPGGRKSEGHYKKKENMLFEHRYTVNYHPQARIPKWLACVVNDQKRKRLLGFFLYANGSYVAELLTYKQLPRLTYNKPFQGFMPTLGQTVDLSEVTYGKEIHNVEMYPGYGGALARAGGEACVVLRGTEPNLVPLLLPSKEVRLFDTVAKATFGRRAGAMNRKQQLYGQKANKKYRPRRPAVAAKKRSVSEHAAGGGNGYKYNLVVQLDWKQHPFQKVKTKYWLSGYILRSRQYTMKASVADLKAKTYSWASRDPVYR